MAAAETLVFQNGLYAVKYRGCLISIVFHRMKNQKQYFTSGDKQIAFLIVFTHAHCSGYRRTVETEKYRATCF